MSGRVLALTTAVVMLSFVCLAEAQSSHPRALSIQPVWIPPSGFGGCGPAPGHPCDVFPAGSDVHIVVLVINVSDHPVTFRNLRWAPAVVYEIRDEEGNPAHETEKLQKLKEEFYADERNQRYRYEVGSPFVNDRIDRASPLDRVLFGGQWFMSGSSFKL